MITNGIIFSSPAGNLNHLSLSESAVVVVVLGRRIMALLCYQLIALFDSIYTVD